MINHFEYSESIVEVLAGRFEGRGRDYFKVPVIERGNATRSRDYYLRAGSGRHGVFGGLVQRIN